MTGQVCFNLIVYFVSLQTIDSTIQTVSLSREITVVNIDLVVLIWVLCR